MKTECANCLAKFNDSREYAVHLIEKHPGDTIRVAWAREVLEPSEPVESPRGIVGKFFGKKRPKKDTPVTLVNVEASLPRVEVVVPAVSVPEMTKERAAIILGTVTSIPGLRDAMTLARDVLSEKTVKLGDSLTLTPNVVAQMLIKCGTYISSSLEYRGRGDLRDACAEALVLSKLLCEQLGYEPGELEKLGLECLRKRVSKTVGEKEE